MPRKGEPMGDLIIRQERDETSGVWIVGIAGFLDSYTVSKLERSLQGLIADGDGRIVVDFGRLEYISSAGIGVFMSVVGPARSKGGDIILAAMSPKIAKIFTLLGFTQIFRMSGTVPEALAQFRQ
jgi:anti-sigma B factor antagonist